MILLLLYGPFVVLSIITFFCRGYFVRAGLPAGNSRNPFLNVIYWFKITGLRPGWAILFFVPYINVLFIFILAILIKNSYEPVKGGAYKKGNAASTTWSFLWVDIILFILLKRSILNTFIFSVFAIPTSSMEKTYMTGDLIIAEKVSYGPRLPVTPLSLPFFHSTLPHSGMPSYLASLQLPYYRFPGNTTIARNDVVVFNYPIQSQLPVDKREYFMKRCVALPGDTLQIIDGVLFVNCQKTWQPPGGQKMYLVRTDGTEIDFKTFEKLGVTEGGKYTAEPGLYLVGLTTAIRDSLKSLAYVRQVEPSIRTKNKIDYQQYRFPADTVHYKWNADQYGPLVIPKKGVTVTLNPATIAIYERIVSVYEHNRLEVQADSSILINGVKTSSYTFKMNYYFMMGDNRDNSEDSRFWGFVPEDHIDSRVWNKLKLPKRLATYFGRKF